MSRRFLLLVLIAALLAGAAFGVRSLIRPASIAPSSPVVRYPNPYADIQQFMEGIYAAEKNGSAPPSAAHIRAVIVPHHLTATETIASGIRMLKQQRFKKILLLSPDHFNHCKTILCTVNATFDTEFGPVHSTTNTVESLLTSPLVTTNTDLFNTEHGIYAVLPYIAHDFPNVEVTPLVLSQRLPWKQEEARIMDALRSAVDDDTILIVSSDFSHYLPYKTAEEKDEQTAKTIFANDLASVASLENPSQSDCPSCLWALASLAAERGFYNPSVVMHTNSATILHDELVPSTTSHFSMVWYENAKLTADDAAVAGDVTLTRSKPRPFPAAVRAWWNGNGPRFVNLEGPLASACTPRSNPFLFCNLETSWRAIRNLATHWGVENNHMLDLSNAGVAETQQLIAQNGETPVSTTGVDAGNVRFIALTTILNPVAETPTKNLRKDLAAVIEELRATPSEKLTVVLVHGGEEYRALPRQADETLAERLIDAGADAVVFAHAHVVGDTALYHGKPIFRGIGNFVFDQTDRIETETTKLVRLRKEGGTISFETKVERLP